MKLDQRGLCLQKYSPGAPESARKCKHVPASARKPASTRKCQEVQQEVARLKTLEKPFNPVPTLDGR